MNDPQNPYQSPIAPPPPQQYGGVYNPTWKQILFSFQGRIRRAHYWAGFGVQMLLAFVIVVPIFIMAASDSGNSEALPAVSVILMLVVYFFIIWISLATQAKRWHDRNKSAWWILINLIPYIGGLWAFIECGCLPGVEPNTYGPAAA